VRYVILAYFYASARTLRADHRRNRQWAKEHPEQPDRAWFLRKVTPKLDALSLAEIAKATGLSLAACSRFRAGTRTPHPRHWQEFFSLVEGS
jgi:hypothetical protein